MPNTSFFEETYGLSTAIALYTSSVSVMGNSLTLSENTSPGEGEFTFDNSTNIIHCLKNNTGKRGYFAIAIENISVGDIIVAQMECNSISGTKPKIVMDILGGTKPGTDIIGAEVMQSTIDYNKWTTISLSKVHEYSDRDYLRIMFGIGSNDTGEFLLRNLKVRVLRQLKNPQLYPEIQTFNFTKQNGVWSIADDFGTNSGATISITDDNKFMNISYKKPFLSNKRPIALATMDFFNGGGKYRVMPMGSKHASVTLLIQDIKDYVEVGNQTKDWTTVDDGVYFNLTVIG